MGIRVRPRRDGRGGAGTLLTGLFAVLALALWVAPARAANPLFTFVPVPPPPPANSTPPPTGYLNGPCGLAVDSSGRFYIADHYHDVVDVYSPSADYSSPTATGATGYQGQLSAPDSLGGPCGLAIDASNKLYVSSYHRGVRKYGAFGSFGAGAAVSGVEQSTGIAVAKSSGDLYVNEGDEVDIYDSAGTQIETIGSGDLDDAYGVAVSGFTGSPSTAGYTYVPDAGSGTVKVFDSSGALVDELKDPFNKPFVSLREASIAIDDASGEVYFTDNTQPQDAEQPQAIVYAYGPDGNWDGYLRDRVVTALPAGIAVDNSGTSTQGRIYVASGNTHVSGIYGYPAGAAATAASHPPAIPGAPRGGGDSNPSISIGDSSNQILCQGDACQLLPSPPPDPTLTTLLAGPGNPKVRYQNTNCTMIAATARRLARQGRALSRQARRTGNPQQARKLRAKAKQLRKQSERRSRAAGRCRRARKSGASASASSPVAASPARALAPTGSSGGGEDARLATSNPSPSLSSSPSSAITQGLLPGGDGFGVELRTGGKPATQAGSHPYRVSFTVGLDQSGGQEDLRSVSFGLPSGFLINPAALGFCPNSSFLTSRTSPYFSSESGEDCHQLFQAGTIDITTATETRRFGVFHLIPPNDGTAMRFGAAPFGQHLRFDATLSSSSADGGLALSLSADIPQGLEAHSMRLTLWGTPWDESHNTERGDCLDETDPSFGWSRCSVGDPINSPPLAMLTLPTLCGDPLGFDLRAQSWQDPGELTAQALNRDSGGSPTPVDGCASLNFNPSPLGILSVEKASSPSGFVFRLDNDDPALTNPRVPIRSHPKKAVVELPDGVTLNPSLGAGLGVCTPAQYAAETLAGSTSACPADSKIGDFLVQTPYYSGTLRGSIFLAKPHDNPFDSLLAVYLVARSTDRGILIRLPGELAPDPGDGTLTATFDGLPQLPYTNLDVVFRTGQRAPLVSPPQCGNARTRITISPWAQGAPTDVTNSDSGITTGIGNGPCPTPGAPPFDPEIVTGGVNSNVGSYTPYYVHIARQDTEQEITSYSLVLPEGITGKLAGIPFCPEAAIEAARANGGFAEADAPSCPAASQVGTTLTGYGVGSALTYASGRVYLAGPYHGAPLSLVTVNSATVGPFDLGTIVIRSAFQVDPHTAQLRIDSSVSDPIPHIIDGIPLHLRDVRIYVDRYQFTHNPSSCAPSELTSTITGSGATFSNPADDSSATSARHFQLLNCRTLGFQPKLGIRLRGGSRRGAFPQLRATFASRGPQDSNLKRIEVEMPHSVFLAQNHIKAICTRSQFVNQNCPSNSVYGKAVAYTPLFDEPLRGNVYLRSSSNRLPDLVADLYSGAVRIIIEGRIGPTKHGGVDAFFDNLPDEPLDRFTMTLFGGHRGLLQNSSNICTNLPIASVKGLAQNNIGRIFTTKLRGQCSQRKRQQKRRQHHRAARK